ncbi:hypothetical protein FRC08_005457 [Ceratobasidium sp. 394]|nr:hypothetical protein FRC08_005457 [Ceratobasidium sp. 394]KAG9098574.1 hypothetical protein FS749_003517 [Ceratobasidium sp. UAMH 11750]
MSAIKTETSPPSSRSASPEVPVWDMMVEVQKPKVEDKEPKVGGEKLKVEDEKPKVEGKNPKVEDEKLKVKPGAEGANGTAEESSAAAIPAAHAIMGTPAQLAQSPAQPDQLLVQPAEPPAAQPAQPPTAESAEPPAQQAQQRKRKRSLLGRNYVEDEGTKRAIAHCTRFQMLKLVCEFIEHQRSMRQVQVVLPPRRKIQRK